MTAVAAIAGLVFDLDGVLLHGKVAVPGAAAAVAALKRQGLRLVVCTQENYQTQAEVAGRLAAQGLAFDPEEVVTGGRVAAQVVADEYPGARVLAIGGPGLLGSLQERGVALVDCSEATSADLVVMGRDPAFNNERLNAACQAIWRGARFLATNYDPKIPTEQGFAPATGAFVKAVAYASGVEPVILAKPSRWAAQACLHTLGVPAAAAVMIGDQYQQDVGMGKQAGMQTILLLSGATAAADLPLIPSELQPDAILPDVTHVPGWLARVTA